MKFLALSQLTDGTTEADIAPLVAAEAAEAWRHYLDGVVREAYFRNPPAAPGVALVLEADSHAGAEALLAAMPLSVAGLIRFDVMPLGPFLPWNALLATDGQER